MPQSPVGVLKILFRPLHHGPVPADCLLRLRDISLCLLPVLKAQSLSFSRKLGRFRFDCRTYARNLLCQLLQRPASFRQRLLPLRYDLLKPSLPPDSFILRFDGPVQLSRLPAQLSQLCPDCAFERVQCYPLPDLLRLPEDCFFRRLNLRTGRSATFAQAPCLLLRFFGLLFCLIQLCLARCLFRLFCRLRVRRRAADRAGSPLLQPLG